MLNIRKSPPAKINLPATSGLGKPRGGITSIARQTGATSAFRQFGDTVSRAKSGERSEKIFGSINRAIKAGKSAPNTENGGPKPKINPAFKPIIK